MHMSCSDHCSNYPGFGVVLWIIWLLRDCGKYTGFSLELCMEGLVCECVRCS